MNTIQLFVQNVVCSFDKKSALNQLNKDNIEEHKKRIVQALSTEGFTDYNNCPIAEKIWRSKDINIRQLFWEWEVLYHLGEYSTGHYKRSAIISIFKEMNKISYDDL